MRIVIPKVDFKHDYILVPLPAPAVILVPHIVGGGDGHAFVIAVDPDGLIQIREAYSQCPYHAAPSSVAVDAVCDFIPHDLRVCL